MKLDAIKDMLSKLSVRHIIERLAYEQEIREKDEYYREHPPEEQRQ